MPRTLPKRKLLVPPLHPQRLATSADAADNFARPLDASWAAQAAEAQCFCHTVRTQVDLSSKEVVFVDAIMACCNTILKRFRVVNLHRSEPNLPKLPDWTPEVLQQVPLNVLRRMCTAYELKKDIKNVRVSVVS